MTQPLIEYPLHRVADLSLAELGEEAMLFAKNEMPGITALAKKYAGQQPLKGARIAGCLHVTVQTAVFIELLVELGAEVAWSSCNVLSTEDKAAAALARRGISVYAWKGETEAEYRWCIRAVLAKWADGPNLLVDDGGDLSSLVHQEYSHFLPGIAGQTEQTTTGTHLLEQLVRKQLLEIPAICVNESVMKTKFDNIYGCRESLIDGIKRATDAMIAGKRAHVCGYGDVGKGCAQALARMGAVVTVSEVDPICAMQAVMEGYQVRSVEQVVREVDIWVTATGNQQILTGADIEQMKHLAVLANIGHFNVEIDTAWIYQHAQQVVPLGNSAERIVLPHGRSIILLAQGRLVNLGCATGHSSFVMSTSFCCQALAVLRLWSAHCRGNRLPVGTLMYLTKEEDEEIARIHLEGLGHTLTTLTASQADYMSVPVTGPFKGPGYKY